MEVSEIKRYCMSKAKAEEAFPFGAVPICYRLEGKIFAQLYPNALDFKITLKCTFELGEMYRSLFPKQVKRGYHCPPVQQPYWNTVQLSGFPDDILLDMIDSAYDTVLHSFSKKKQREILGNEDGI